MENFTITLNALFARIADESICDAHVKTKENLFWSILGDVENHLNKNSVSWESAKFYLSLKCKEAGFPRESVCLEWNCSHGYHVYMA